MADLEISGKSYTGINKVKIPTTDDQMALFTFSRLLPADGTTLLDYLDTTGNGCVDIGMKLNFPSTGYKLYMKFGILNATQTQIVFSSGLASPSRQQTDQLVILSSKLRVDRYTASGGATIAANNVVEYVEENGSISINNLTTSATNSYTANSSMMNISPTNNYVLFGEPQNGSYATFATLKFYEFYYKEGGVDLIHLYPAIDTNGDYCLYDSVSNTCIYSSNGAFE